MIGSWRSVLPSGMLIVLPIGLVLLPHGVADMPLKQGPDAFTCGMVENGHGGSWTGGR